MCVTGVACVDDNVGAATCYHIGRVSLLWGCRMPSQDVKDVIAVIL